MPTLKPIAWRVSVSTLMPFGNFLGSGRRRLVWGSRWDLMDQQSSTVVVSKDDGEGEGGGEGLLM